MFHPWVGKMPRRRERLPTPVFWPGHIAHGVAKSRTRSDLHFEYSWASLVAKTVKNLPAMGETWGNPLEMTTHSTILAGEIPWTEEPGGLQSAGSQRVGRD